MLALLVLFTNFRPYAATGDLELWSSQPWDLNEPCQPYIKHFADVSAKLVNCVVHYSSPPKVCTYCTDEYVAFKHVEYQLHHLKNISSFANTSCDRVIFVNYLVSYVDEVAGALTRNIWQQSRCSSCVVIDWKFKENHTEYRFQESTIVFQNKLYAWRRCVSNHSVDADIQSTVCNQCASTFDDLFDFYWKIYVTPHIDFCLDVETVMNDTMSLWHNVWRCADNKEEPRDWTLLVFSSVALAVLNVLFYVSGFVRSEQVHRQLVQYSRLEVPHGHRSHILSSSTLDDDESHAGSVDDVSRFQ